MLGYRSIAAWLRPVAGLFALAGLLALTACGGGSGAPNNPFEPGPSTPPALVVLPGILTVYSHTPATLAVTGGIPPYSAFSSDPAILPVSQGVPGGTVLLVANDVVTDTLVTITIQDAVGQTKTAAVTVKAAPLLPNLVTITPNNDCPGSPQNLGGALCSGGTGTATVRVTGPGGAPIPGRQVRFDVVQGDFAIQSSNPATPLVSTLTVISDANGNAVVGIAIPVNAVTQIGVIRATDVTTGNQVSGQFTITQVTDGSAVLSMIPTGNTTITGPLQNVCSSNARVSYYIFGGTPPYTVRAAFPDVVTLVGVPVLTNGGHFDAITNGSCFTNMQFAVTDATGRTIPGGSSPTLTNEPGTVTPTPPAPAPALVVAPSTVTISAASGGCAGKTLQFTVTGGTPSYFASIAMNPAFTPAPVLTPNPVGISGAVLNVAFPSPITSPTPAVGTGTVTFVDSGNPQKTATATITCQ